MNELDAHSEFQSSPADRPQPVTLGADCGPTNQTGVSNLPVRYTTGRGEGSSRAADSRVTGSRRERRQRRMEEYQQRSAGASRSQGNAPSSVVNPHGQASLASASALAQFQNNPPLGDNAILAL